MSWCRIRRVFNIFLKGGGVRQTGNNANVDWFLVDCPAEVDFSGWRDWLGIRCGLCYRFSAFWLRSKCSICSYQLNIWYGSHVLSSILIWFLTGDGVLGLALALSQVSLVLQYHQDRPLPHSTPGSQAICIAIVKRFSWYPFRQRWVLGLAGRDSRRAAGSAYLPGTEVNHDQVGGSSRLSPATLHSVADGIYNYLKRR